MTYLLLFLEGVLTFISPCLLPMLPIYVTFFAGGEAESGKGRTLANALGFVLGFSAVFVLLGVFAGTLGRLLVAHRTAVNIVSGVIVILLGLHFMGALRLPWLERSARLQAKTANLRFGSSVLFGVVFSIGWTPCVGVFLGSALMLAAQQGSVWQGSLLLLCYSAGLGVPFVISALLIEEVKTVSAKIKKHYKVINAVSGAVLILTGVLMATGLLNRFLAILQ